MRKLFFLFSCIVLLQGFCKEQNNDNSCKDTSVEIGSPIVEKSTCIKSVSKQEILAKKPPSLVFTNKLTLIDEECLQDCEGIELEDVKVKRLEKFQEEFLCFLNKPLAFEVLEKIKDKTFIYFKKNMPFFVDVKVLENQEVAYEDTLVKIDSSIVEKPTCIKSVSKQEILAKKITSLIFTNKLTLIDEEYLQDYEGIELEGIEVKSLEKFQEEFLCFLNKPLTFEILEKIKDKALTYFKNNTPFLVDVKILENQDVSSGKLQILVTFARLGEITSRGAKYFSNSRLLKRLNVEHDECINIHRIQKYLASLNQNPFRNTSLILEPGEETGYTDIHLQTQDIFPVRGFGGYENTGNEIASQHRFLTGLNFGNFLYLDHQMNIEFKFAPNISNWWGLSGNYIIPTYYDTYLKLIGSYVRTKPDTEPNYDMRGKAWTVLGRYHVPIYLFEDGTNELIFGYDFKRTNNFLNFIATSVFNNLIDISQFVFQFTGTANDRLGLTSYLLSFYYSPGDMTNHNENQDFRIEGYAQKSRYFYATLHFDRTFRIPKEFLCVIEFFAQIASVKLLPTEQISIGGFYTVRGYQENAVFGDDGFYLRNEIRSPNMKYTKYKNIKLDWQFLAFVDVGYVTDVNDNVSDKNSSFLASLGPGLRCMASDYFILKLDYGIQLKKANRDFFAKSWHSKLHAFVSFQY